jgi:D-tyrosyl-tRNA(Tyr) deacylase
MLQRLIGYRIFADSDGKMNLGLKDIQGGLLLVPQFTLVADTSSGMRPGFSSAASPEQGERVFTSLCQRALELYPTVKKGKFSADMQVHLVNDGPVTFYLRCT